MRKYLLSAAMIFGLSCNASATMTVFDPSAVGKLVDQLTKMQEQITAMNEIQAIMDNIQGAMGAIGKISIPVPNVDSLGETFSQNLQCIKPDMSKVMPDVNFQNIDFGNICDGKSAYEQTLFSDENELSGLGSFEDRTTYLKGITKRREAMAKDATLTALATAEAGIEKAEQSKDAADELQEKGRDADTEREQLAVINESIIALFRAQNETNELLRTLVKLQATQSISQQPQNAFAE